jgi:arylsulfatase A-like enzyme
MLKEKGYATACICKWNLGWNWNFLADPSGRKEFWNREVKYYLPDEVDWESPIKEARYHMASITTLGTMCQIFHHIPGLKMTTL